MKLIRVFTVTLLTLAVAAGAIDAQVKDWEKIKFPDMRPFVVPQPERVEMENGMVVLLLEDHELPIIDIDAYIRTGSGFDPPEQIGLADVFGEVWRTGGTKNMTGDEMDDYLEARAASVETSAGVGVTFASASSLKDDFPDVLGVFNDVLRNPIFDEEKIEVATTLMNAVVARRNDDAQQIMQREFAKLVYGTDSPYAWSAEYDTISAISRGDLQAFHEKYIHPNRIVMGVVGDFRKEEMVALLEKTFSGWSKGSDMELPEPKFNTEAVAGMHFIPKDDITQSNIIMGHLGVREDNPDIFALEVFNMAYSGSFTARLFNNVRTKKGLAYRVRGGVGSNFSRPGMFTTWMTTKTETTAAGIDALMEEIDKVTGSEPMSKDEIAAAKEAMLNSFVFNYDSTAEILAQQMTYAYHGFPSDYLAKYRENIQKVTADDVARVAKKYIHKEHLAILVVGPSEGLDKPLDSFGTVATIDITIPGPSTPAMPEATAETLAAGKEVFARAVTGFGNTATVDAVTSMKTVADMTLTLPQGQFTLGLTTTIAVPDKFRQEMKTPMGDIVIVVDGDTGFQKGPQSGPLPDNDRAEVIRSIWRNPLLLTQRRNDEGFSAQHLGEETIEGKACDVVLVKVDGDALKLSVAKETGQVLKMEFQGPHPLTKQPGTQASTYSDFREIDGVTLAFKVEATFDGKPFQSVTVKELAVNPSVDAALFTAGGSDTASAGGSK